MRLTPLFFIFAALQAHAQVNKCVHPKTGKITYSDTRCDTSQSEKLLENRKSNDEIMAERMQAQKQMNVVSLSMPMKCSGHLRPRKKFAQTNLILTSAD